MVQRIYRRIDLPVRRSRRYAATGIGVKIASKKVNEKPNSDVQKSSEHSSGTRQGDTKSPDKGGSYKINDKVFVLWSGGWYKAQILEDKSPKY